MVCLNREILTNEKYAKIIHLPSTLGLIQTSSFDWVLMVSIPLETITSYKPLSIRSTLGNVNLLRFPFDSILYFPDGIISWPLKSLK